jgi:hypothetical protein
MVARLAPVLGKVSVHAKIARRRESTCFFLICQPIFVWLAPSRIQHIKVSGPSCAVKMPLKQIVVHDRFWPTRRQATGITARHCNLFICLFFSVLMQVTELI